MTPMRVVVVDEASAQRDELVRALHADVVVVAVCGSAAEAVSTVDAVRPDAVLLSLALPGGQGRRVIEQVMARVPTPILVLSSCAGEQASHTVLDALVAGALDALPRPSRWSDADAADLRRRLRRISTVPVIRHPRGGRPVRRSDDRGHGGGRGDLGPVVAVGASTGGPSALATLLGGLGELPAPVLVVQHLHPDFTAGLVAWMGRASALPVELASAGQLPRPGRVYVAPAGRHLVLGTEGHLDLRPEPAGVHCPSVDELFRSVARSAGTAAVGVLLTGMGEDGAAGLLAVREHGGLTLAQDEQSCAVFGMPRAAQRLGAVEETVPLGRLAATIRRAVRALSPAAPT